MKLALSPRAPTSNEWQSYRCVDNVVASEVGILVKTVMSPAKCDTRTAAGNQAGVNGVEALKEAGIPGRGAGGLGDFGAVGSNVVETTHPVVHILLHLRFLHRRAVLNWSLSGHCCV